MGSTYVSRRVGWCGPPCWPLSSRAGHRLGPSPRRAEGLGGAPYNDRVLSLVLGAALVLGFRPALGCQDVQPSLPEWCGKDIARLPDAERAKFMSYVNRDLVVASNDRGLLSGDPEWIFDSHGDAYVWSFGDTNDHRFLIYLNPHTGVIPSSEHAWLFIVDKQGKIVSRSDFDTGWRMWADGASYEKVGWLSSRVLIQEMRVGLNGGGPRRIYFGFDGLRPRVIRLDDAKGNLFAMNYWAPNWVVGPRYDPPPGPVMEQALAGSNEVKRLEALVWLAGHHGTVSMNSPGTDHEETADEVRYAECIHDPAIIRVVKGLRNSPNPYISELAKSIPSSAYDMSWWQ